MPRKTRPSELQDNTECCTDVSDCNVMMCNALWPQQSIVLIIKSLKIILFLIIMVYASRELQDGKVRTGNMEGGREGGRERGGGREGEKYKERKDPEEGERERK